MVLDATLLNTQKYKVRINDKVEQSREWSCAPSLHLGVVAIEKGTFGSPSIKVVNYTNSIYSSLLPLFSLVFYILLLLLFISTLWVDTLFIILIILFLVLLTLINYRRFLLRNSELMHFSDTTH